MDVNPNTHTVWVYDFFARELTALNGRGENLGLNLMTPGTVDIAVNPADNSFWVLLQDSGKIQHFSADGRLLATFEGFQSPSAMTLDPKTGGLWVLNRGTAEAWQVAADGQIGLKLSGFEHGRDIALDAKRNSLWISDSSAVVKIDLHSPEDQQTFGDFHFVRRIAINPQNGDCWFIDWSFFREDSRVLRYTVQGRMALEKTGFSDLTALSVDEFNGNCFVVEGQPGNLVQLSPNGSILSKLHLGGSLGEVVVENLQP